MTARADELRALAKQLLHCSRLAEELTRPSNDLRVHELLSELDDAREKLERIAERKASART